MFESNPFGSDVTGVALLCLLLIFTTVSVFDEPFLFGMTILVASFMSMAVLFDKLLLVFETIFSTHGTALNGFVSDVPRGDEHVVAAAVCGAFTDFALPSDSFCCCVC